MDLFAGDSGVQQLGLRTSHRVSGLFYRWPARTVVESDAALASLLEGNQMEANGRQLAWCQLAGVVCLLFLPRRNSPT